ncbi:MAG: hypothetical protein GY934_02070 [Gammaproteobacteria bacterium]|nr:hypothetical protein [Gammaproteobacteria bacterium]
MCRGIASSYTGLNAAYVKGHVDALIDFGEYWAYTSYIASSIFAAPRAVVGWSVVQVMAVQSPKVISAVVKSQQAISTISTTAKIHGKAAVVSTSPLWGNPQIQSNIVDATRSYLDYRSTPGFSLGGFFGWSAYQVAPYE